jgi:hypothetical protein
VSKTLPEGTRKIILIDNEAAERNAKRRAGRTEKVLRVIVEDQTGPVQIVRAMTARCVSAATVEYSQHGFVAGNQRAALVTTGEVVLDENVADDLAEETPPNPEATPQATKPATPTKPQAASKAASKVKTDKKDDTAE